ncbi:hypothetical protein Tco_0103370 [Tanacetum coccineum]
MLFCISLQSKPYTSLAIHFPLKMGLHVSVALVLSWIFKLALFVPWCSTFPGKVYLVTVETLYLRYIIPSKRAATSNPLLPDHLYEFAPSPAIGD